MILNEKIKKIGKFIFSLILTPLKTIPLKKDTIIIQSTDPYQYSNNPRYLFEFLSKKKMKIYWFCQNSKVEKHLKNKKLNFISLNNPFKLIFISLKAKIIIDGGSNYYNFLNLPPKSAKKIHIGHGAANKTVLLKFYKSNVIDTYFDKFDYVNFPSNYAIEKVAKKQYKLKKNKIIKLGYPKFEELKKGRQKKRKKNKTILYTPTWRPYEYPLPIIKLKDFNIKDFRLFLKENNITFVYSRHSINSKFDKDCIEDKENIFFINTKKNPLFDTTKYLRSIDLLINDCSSTSIESLFLNLPQINIFPDLKKYTRKSGFLNEYNENPTGPILNNYSQLKKFIKLYLNNPSIYKKKYKMNNSIEKKRYYDLYNYNSNYFCYNFIKSLL